MIERILEGVIFGSRWLLAPIYLGLIGVLLAAMDRIARTPDELAEAHVRAQMLLNGEVQPHGRSVVIPEAPDGVERRAPDSPLRGNA